MLKNAMLFSVSETLDAEKLKQDLQKRQFSPCGAVEKMSIGFVPFAEGLDLIHAVSGVRAGTVRVDKKTLPGSAVKQLLKEKCAEIEAQQGFAPGRKQTKEIKENLIDELLPRVIPSTKLINFFLYDDLLMIDTSSSATADVVIGLLAKCVDPLPASIVYTETSAGTAMTEWLVSDEAPDGFTVDQDIEMKAPTKATVRWNNDTVDFEEAKSHFTQGKQCTKMALTWRDKFTFVLNDKLVLTKIKPLDVKTEEANALDKDDIDGTIALFGGELYAMANDVIESLGGLLKD